MTQSRRERVEDVDSRDKPTCQSLIATPGLIKLVDLVKKYGTNVTGRVAGLQLCCEGMCEQVGLRLFLIGVDGSDEDGAKMGGRCGCGGRLGHRDTLISARNSEGDREPVNIDVKSDSV